MPEGKKTALTPPGVAVAPVLESADDGDVSKSTKTDADMLLAAQKLAADNMFGERSPMTLEPQQRTPEYIPDGM